MSLKERRDDKIGGGSVRSCLNGVRVYWMIGYGKRFPPAPDGLIENQHRVQDVEDRAQTVDKGDKINGIIKES